jgi:hypothetical protein
MSDDISTGDLIHWGTPKYQMIRSSINGDMVVDMPEVRQQLVRDMNARMDSIMLASFGVTMTAAAPSSSLTAEKVKRMIDKFTPQRVTIGGKLFKVYEWNVHQGGEVPDDLTFLTRKRDEDDYLPLDEPIGGGLIIIDHKAGKVAGREKDLQHFLAHCELIEESEK